MESGTLLDGWATSIATSGFRLGQGNGGRYLSRPKEGYRLTVDDDTNRVQVRVSPKPYTKVNGHLRGEPDAMDDLRAAITSDEVDVGQAELLYRDGVYYRAGIPRRPREYIKATIPSGRR